jgi:hypothetical protein
MAEIVELSTIYCTDGLPNSLIWARPETPREHMNITVAKLGKGVTVTFAHKGFSGRDLSTLPASYMVR